MKIKEGFLMREVAGKPVVIPGEKAGKDFSGMIKLNETGKIIWEALEQGMTEEEIAGQLVLRYGISEDEAKEDTHAFLEQMKEEGFLEE